MVFIENDDAVEELLSTDDAKALVQLVCAEGVRYAIAAQPNLTGEHDSDFVASPVVLDEDGIASGAFGSESPSWHIMEFGSVHNPPFRPLTKAAEQLGLRYEPS